MPDAAGAQCLTSVVRHHYTLTKKFIIIGFAVALAVASALLCQHLQHSGDAKLARQITGTWTRGLPTWAGGPLFSRTISPDGSFSTSIGHSNALVTYQGTWLIKDQILVMAVTNAHGTGGRKAGSPVGSVDRVKIIQVDDHHFIYEAGGHTNRWYR
jgi:hypothetical protein